MKKIQKKVVLMNGLWHQGDFFYKGLAYYLAQADIYLTQWFLLTHNNAGLQAQVQHLRNHLLNIGLNEVTLVVHSISCSVVLEYLRRYGRQGIKEVFLITPLPRNGGLMPALKVARAFPEIFLKALWEKNLGLFVKNKEAVRKLFFDETLTDSMLVYYQSQLGQASFKLFLEVLFPITLPKKNQLPVLHIIGASNDFFMTKEQTAQLARSLGVPKERSMCFPGSHDLLTTDVSMSTLGYLVHTIRDKDEFVEAKEIVIEMRAGKMRA